MLVSDSGGAVPFQPPVRNPAQDAPVPKPDSQPAPQSNDQAQAEYMAKTASGEVLSHELKPEGSEGLWDMAHEMQKMLGPEMRKTNTPETTFNKLRDDAVKNHGFELGTDDGRLPSQFQGSQKSGRDLDLIYAGDKFNIKLNAPTEPVKPAGNKPETEAAYEGLSADEKAGWNRFAAADPKVGETYRQLEAPAQIDVLKGYVAASSAGPETLNAYGALIGSEGFRSLDAAKQRKALSVAASDKDGGHGACLGERCRVQGPWRQGVAA